MLEYLNVKGSLQKVTLQLDLKNCLSLKKKYCPVDICYLYYMEKKVLEPLTEKNCERQIKISIEVESNQ